MDDIQHNKIIKNVLAGSLHIISFLAMYKDLYKKRYDEIDVQQSSINSGLSKLLEATFSVGEMKKMLQFEVIYERETHDTILFTEVSRFILMIISSFVKRTFNQKF